MGTDANPAFVRPGGGLWLQFLGGHSGTLEPVPEWVKDRIRATDVEQYALLIESYPL